MELKTTPNNNHWVSYCSDMDEKLLNQVNGIVDSMPETGVVMMPDAHYGTPTPVGLTVSFYSRELELRYAKNIIDIVGNDIGCGVLAVRFFTKDGEDIPQDKLEELYNYINETIMIDVNNLTPLDKSFGTLGQGNHFIELGRDGKGSYMLTVHSGSRGRGARVYRKYKNLNNTNEYKAKVKTLVETMKSLHLHQEINDVIKAIPSSAKGGQSLSEQQFDAYLDEMDKAVEWAKNSRALMSGLIMSYIYDNVTSYTVEERIENIHNYYDIEHKIVRKGAINGRDYTIVTPLSMKEGIFVSLADPNHQNNYSAMHGAGRVFSRKDARNYGSVTDLKLEMAGIISHPRESILDEAPWGYKKWGDIKYDVKEIASPILHYRPVLNFKGSDEGRFTK